MNRTNTQFERQIEIDRRVREGVFPSVPELSADMEVTERTIKRDIEFMRDRLGAPIEYDRKRRGYIYTEPSWVMAAITLREREVVALLLARQALGQYESLSLGEMLNQFYEQVLHVAGRQVGATAEQILKGFSFITPPSVSVDPDKWAQLCQCVLKCHSLEISYQSVSNPKLQKYRIDPLHIANIEGEWYLFGRSHYKGDIIQLAISRMKDVADTQKRFQPLEGFDPEELKQKLFGRYASMQGDMETVCIQIDADHAPQIQLKQWHAEQQLVELADGGIEISFPVASGGSKQPYANVLGWVLGMGRHAKVLAPEKFQQFVADEIRAMGEVY